MLNNLGDRQILYLAAAEQIPNFSTDNFEFCFIDS